MSDYNPSVRQIPREQLAPVIPERQNSSILTWLESTGRLIPREPVDSLLDEPDSEEISDLMGSEDASFDDDDTATSADDDD
jgi:hypothetical protein